MKPPRVGRKFARPVLLAVACAGVWPAVLPTVLLAQAKPATTAPAVARDVSAAAELRGRPVEGVRVTGNAQVATAVILNVVRTREGDKFDPATVQEDYQRVYSLRRFSNVEARVEPTATGVVVVFTVTEQKQITGITLLGNVGIDDLTLRAGLDLREGESIDPFRIAQARRSIQEFYRAKNYPLANVNLDNDILARKGEVVFTIVEGPKTYIRNVTFQGNKSITASKLSDQVKSKSWIWIIRPGTFAAEQVDDDVAAIRQYYKQKGFFDARVGRKLVFSPDQTELQIDFLIDEGPRYTIDQLTFKGNDKLTEQQLRAVIKTHEGRPYDDEVVQRDIRAIVKAYSPFGYIYDPQSTDPDYLRVALTPVFKLKPGTIELVVAVQEGKQFTVGEIQVRGNTRTQDKVVLRETRGLAPGDLFDASKLQDFAERLRGRPYFSQVKVTPVGDDPKKRDILVEVTEAPTALLAIGAGVNSNGGIGGNITYTQKNFDISNWPRSFRDAFSDKAFVGAGQTFRISFEPGTRATNASVRFTEPYILDQPYSFTGEVFLRDRKREVYDDTRVGGRAVFGHQFTDEWSGTIGFRGESIEISNIDDKPIRAFEILDAQGNSALTSVSVGVRRDTTLGGILPSKGTSTVFTLESVGALGGDYTFQKFTFSHDAYFTLGEDLLDRKTILALHGDAGYIAGGAPFFERFYGGGINSIRGFAFRGVTPRSGPDDDRIGGEFSITGSAEVNFPLVEDLLRGVVFVDGGMVESDFEFGTLRSSVGLGVRISLPVLGQVPIAIDFGFPITKNSEDETQIISFSLGFTP